MRLGLHLAPVIQYRSAFLHFARRSLRLGFIGCALLPFWTWAAEPSAPANGVKPPPAEKFDLSSLLPTAWQKNPRLHFVVVTEMTEEGKKRPAASPEHPAFFQLHSAGYHEQGEVLAGEKTIKREEIERVLLRALSTNGYLPANDSEHPPSLFITYGWGLHNRFDPDALSATERARNILDRAALVGGEKFARRLTEVLREAETFSIMAKNLPAEVQEFANPIYQFKMESSKTAFLVEQSAEDIYFVVASAYDYSAATERKRVLLWRTRMTVASRGVTQQGSLPTLVATAGPFFGKETDVAQVIPRHTLREGSVELGTPTVVTSRDGTDSPAAEKK